MEAAIKLLEKINFSPRYLVPVAFVTGFALFSSPTILDIFGIASLVSQYRAYLGAAFLISVAIITVHWSVQLYSIVEKRIASAKSVKSLQDRLHNLTEYEKRILRYYLKYQTKTAYLPLHDGVINGLILDGVVFRVTNVGNPNNWAHNIQPWAWDYLNKTPHLLASASGNNDVPVLSERIW